jgi:hypothetical protein
MQSNLGPMLETRNLKLDDNFLVFRVSSFKYQVSRRATINRRYLVCDSLKLLEESDIIFEKEPYVIEAGFQHGYPLNSHAKCKARINLGIIIYKPIHFRVIHAGTEDLQPAGI